MTQRTGIVNRCMARTLRAREIVDGRLHCPRCDTWPKIDGDWRRVNITGRASPFPPYCAACSRAVDAKRTRERRTIISARLDAIKLDTGCVDCGYNRAPEALDFDHLPGTEKRFSVGAYGRHSWKMVSAEIAKCEVVCANCHRIRTRARRPTC